MTQFVAIWNTAHQMIALPSHVTTKAAHCVARLVDDVARPVWRCPVLHAVPVEPQAENQSWLLLPH